MPESRQLEQLLIEHCSPTLAGLKTASMFNARYSCADQLKMQLAQLKSELSIRGISLLVLRQSPGRALVYVFRKARLQADLQQRGVPSLLKKCGYTSTDVDSALHTLISRLAAQHGFPHEIGLFLGYPLGDVQGFISNKGKNCKCCGCWKVYCDVNEAMRHFARFKKCKGIYLRLWQQGRSVLQLTVAA